MKRQLAQIGAQGPQPDPQGLRRLPGAVRAGSWKSTLTANATANLTRNLWSYMIIFCGHFPDGALHFTEEELEDETRAEWYLRQMLGSANFEGGRAAAHPVSGSLGYQIEHHLFPDLPSNRYAEIAVKVRALCDKYDIPYTTGPLHRQYGQALRTIMKLSLPNRMTTDDQPDAAAAPDRPRPPADRRRAADPAHGDRRLVDPPVGMTVLPLPHDLAERPRDATYDVPVPFACGDDALGAPVKKRVLQCALSRICGLCGRSLSWGVTFVGSPAEGEAGSFHFPPSHRECAEAALALYPRLGVPVLGQDVLLAEWAVVVTGGFELVRPASRQEDMRVRFTANSVTERRTVAV